MWGKTAVCCPHCYGGLLPEDFARGTSASSLEVDRPWDADNDDHLGLMDHLGIDRFMVMGFCIGGPFIWNLLKRAPDRIVAAVLAPPRGLSEVHAHRPTQRQIMDWAEVEAAGAS